METEYYVLKAHGATLQTTFRVPPNVDIGFYYKPEEASNVGLCTTQAGIPHLCQQRTSFWGHLNEIIPNFVIGPDPQGGIWSCKTGSFIQQIQGDTDLQSIATGISQSDPTKIFILLMAVCSGGKYRMSPGNSYHTRQPFSAFQKSIERQNYETLFNGGLTFADIANSGRPHFIADIFARWVLEARRNGQPDNVTMPQVQTIINHYLANPQVVVAPPGLPPAPVAGGRKRRAKTRSQRKRKSNTKKQT